MGDIFKSLIFDNIVKAALGRLFAAFPLLGWGPIGFIITHYLTKFADILYFALDEFIDVKRIFFKNMELEKKFDSRAVGLQIIYDQTGGESDEFKLARENAKKDLSQYIRFDVARAA